LAIADNSLPPLLYYFHPSRVAWWRDFLSRGRFSLGTLGLVLLGLSIAGLVESVLIPRETAQAFSNTILFAIFCVSVAMPFLYVRFLKPPPIFWIGAPRLSWREAWTVAPLFLVLSALLAPEGTAGELLLMISAAIGWGWVKRAGYLPPDDQPAGKRLASLAKRYWLWVIYLAVHASTLSEPRVAHWLLAGAGLAVLWHYASAHAHEYIRRQNPKWRPVVLIAMIGALVVSALLLASMARPGEGAYYASILSLPCVGLLLLISGLEQQGRSMLFVVLGWFAVIALWVTAVNHAEPRRAKGEASTSWASTPLERTPWKAPECPAPKDAARTPSPPIACGRDGWIRAEDYPRAALRRGAEGRVQTEHEVTEAGRINDCRILASSGHDDLDRATCNLLEDRARFLPGRNGNGDAVPFRYVMTMVWKIQKEKPGAE
jgi:TonB family protein